MQLAIVSDAWRPQVNGVVTTLRRTAESLETLGHAVTVLSPERHRTIPCPTYPEIKLALWPHRRLAAELDELAPDAIHVATEGPLGMAAASYCAARGLAFTASYHTQFPQYVRQRRRSPRTGLTRCCGAITPRAAHARGDGAATPRLVAHGFANVVLWSRGVDVELFQPARRDGLALRRPIFVCVGPRRRREESRGIPRARLAGDQSRHRRWARSRALERRYPAAVFLGLSLRRWSLPRVSRGRCARIPEPHRYLRSRAPRGDGLRHACRGVSGDGADRRRKAGRHGRARRGSASAALAALALDRDGCRRAVEGRTWVRASTQFLVASRARPRRPRPRRTAS